MSDATAQAAPANRSRKRSARFSEADDVLIVRAAALDGLTHSAFIRGASVDAARERLGLPPERRDRAAGATPPQLSPEDRAARDALRVDTKRVGVNLNRLVRLADQGVIDLGELRPVVEEWAAQTEQLVSLLGGSSKGVTS